MCQSLTAPMVIVQTFKGAKDCVNLQRSLEEMNPSYIIMYHSNITAIREIEMYESHRKRDKSLKLYFLIHADTVEEQAYLTSMRREKEAFEFLIQTKSVIVFVVDYAFYSQFCREWWYLKIKMVKVIFAQLYSLI